MMAIWRPTEGLRFVTREIESQAMEGFEIGKVTKTHRILQQTWTRLVNESWEQEWRDVPLQDEGADHERLDAEWRGIKYERKRCADILRDMISLAVSNNGGTRIAVTYLEKAIEAIEAQEAAAIEADA